jgi:hypothetical protein
MPQLQLKQYVRIERAAKKRYTDLQRRNQIRSLQKRQLAYLVHNLCNLRACRCRRSSRRRCRLPSSPLREV